MKSDTKDALTVAQKVTRDRREKITHENDATGSSVCVRERELAT